MHKVVRHTEGKIRKISDTKSSNNLITKEISPTVSLATIEASDYNEKEITDYDRIYYLLEGALELFIENETVELQPGDVCYLSSGTEYEMKGTFRAIVVNQPAFGS